MSRRFATITSYRYSQTSVHERLRSRTVQFTNKFSEPKASRMTYCVSSYEHASHQNVDKNKSHWTTFQWDRGPVGLKQSRVVPRDRKKKKNPLPNNNISLPHHLPLTPSTLLHTGTVKLNYVFVYIWSA